LKETSLTRHPKAFHHGWESNELPMGKTSNEHFLGEACGKV